MPLPKTEDAEFLSRRAPSFMRFFADNGRFPTRAECNIDSPVRKQYGLIGYKTLERRFGGSVAFRTLLGLPDVDMRRSQSHRDKQREATSRHAEALVTLNSALVSKYGRVNVHREESYTDDDRRRTDFRVFGGNGETAFLIDLLVPVSATSQAGCIRTKVKKIFDVGHHLDAPVLLVDAGVGIDAPFTLIQPIDAEFNAPIYTVGMTAFLEALDETKFPFPVI